jgi:hypothetical protein
MEVLEMRLSWRQCEQEGGGKQNSISRYLFTLVLGGLLSFGIFSFYYCSEMKMFLFCRGMTWKRCKCRCLWGWGVNESCFCFLQTKKARAKRGLEREHFVLFFTRVKWILFDIQHLPYACANCYYFFCVSVLLHGSDSVPSQTSKAHPSSSSSIEMFNLNSCRPFLFFCVDTTFRRAAMCNPIQLRRSQSNFSFFLLVCISLAPIFSIPTVGSRWAFYEKNIKIKVTKKIIMIIIFPKWTCMSVCVSRRF